MHVVMLLFYSYICLHIERLCWDWTKRSVVHANVPVYIRSVHYVHTWMRDVCIYNGTIDL